MYGTVIVQHKKNTEQILQIDDSLKLEKTLPLAHFVHLLCRNAEIR